jgi:hypothetical protein
MARLARNCSSNLYGVPDRSQEQVTTPWCPPKIFTGLRLDSRITAPKVIARPGVDRVRRSTDRHSVAAPRLGQNVNEAMESATPRLHANSWLPCRR